MTSSAVAPTEVGPEPTDTDPHRACAVCPHELGNHDAIGLRYCRATQSAAASRGCICAAGK